MISKMYAKESNRNDEKAVEEVLCEVMDMVILEQVTAINNLPSHFGAKYKDPTMKNKEKLQQYENWLLQYTNESPKTTICTSPPKSSGFGRYSNYSSKPSKRGPFWCWRRREGKEKRGWNWMRKDDVISCDDLSKLSQQKLDEKVKKEEKVCVELRK